MRSLAPEEVQGRQREVLDRVEALAAAGIVAAAPITWWSHRVCPPNPDNPLAQSCPAVVSELLDRAAAADFELAPYFDAHPRVGHGDADAITLPVICLVVRRDGEVCGLYPIQRRGRRYTVEDCLTALEAGASVANLED